MKVGLELQRFANLIRDAHESEIAADVTLGGRLLLAQQHPLSISYAPFEHIQHGARIAIVGITPGAQQARNALGELRRQLIAGADHGTALGAAKTFASFSGPMRANLVAMLDHIGLAGWMGLGTPGELWTSRSDLVHFTSAIRYPVFVNGENYSGSPSMVATPLLREALLQYLAEEVSALPDAVWVPLGPKVSEGLAMLVKRGLLSADRLLVGLPHPSGANAERISYFLGRKDRGALSAKTSPDAIDGHRMRLLDQVDHLPRLRG
ncbi:hypothetical protein [Bradyrhizobium sp. RT5a]|uniref:hypothetical protein n=1 Tax=Bradyrhizobium sp. RT5a TaxID=3156380 RepID=UPI003391F270